MLVGAGEIDAALLVVAADDGPRAQTLEHLALLDALGIRDGARRRHEDRRRRRRRGVDVVVAEVEALLAGDVARGRPVLAVSVGRRATGIDALRARPSPDRRRRAVAEPRRPLPAAAARDRPRLLGQGPRRRRDRHAARRPDGARRVAARRARRRIRPRPRDPGPRRDGRVGRPGPDGAQSGRRRRRGATPRRGPDAGSRGRRDGRACSSVSRRPLPDRTRARLHLGTASVDAAVGRSGRDAIGLPDGTVAAILRLAEPLAAAPGDRFVLRRSGGADPVVGGSVLDVAPARGVSRRRQTSRAGGRAAHRPSTRATGGRHRGAARPARGDPGRGHRPAGAGRVGASALPRGGRQWSRRPPCPRSVPPSPGRSARSRPCAAMRPPRRPRSSSTRRCEPVGWSATVTGSDARGCVDRRPTIRHSCRRWIDSSRRSPRRLRRRSTTRPGLPAAHAMGPPAGTDRPDRRPGSGSRLCEHDVPGPRGAGAALATSAPLTPAAFRDATGTSRKYVMAILEDLDRRGILRADA